MNFNLKTVGLGLLAASAATSKSNQVQAGATGKVLADNALKGAGRGTIAAAVMKPLDNIAKALIGDGSEAQKKASTEQGNPLPNMLDTARRTTQNLPLGPVRYGANLAATLTMDGRAPFRQNARELVLPMVLKGSTSKALAALKDNPKIPDAVKTVLSNTGTALEYGAFFVGRKFQDKPTGPAAMGVTGYALGAESVKNANKTIKKHPVEAAAATGFLPAEANKVPDKAASANH